MYIFVRLITRCRRERESFRDKNLFSDVALERCGFEVASKRTLTKSIYRVAPSGERTALYDALVQSLENIKSLYLMIEDSGTVPDWYQPSSSQGWTPA